MSQKPLPPRPLTPSLIRPRIRAPFLRALYDGRRAPRPAGPQPGAFPAHSPRGSHRRHRGGQAGGAMAEAVDALWPAAAPISGLVVTRYDHVPPAYRQRQARGRARIEVVEASHPVPDAAGLAAAERILALTKGLTADGPGAVPDQRRWLFTPDPARPRVWAWPTSRP